MKKLTLPLTDRCTTIFFISSVIKLYDLIKSRAEKSREKINPIFDLLFHCLNNDWIKITHPRAVLFTSFKSLRETD